MLKTRPNEPTFAVPVAERRQCRYHTEQDHREAVRVDPLTALFTLCTCDHLALVESEHGHQDDGHGVVDVLCGVQGNVVAGELYHLGEQHDRQPDRRENTSQRHRFQDVLVDQ